MPETYPVEVTPPDLSAYRDGTDGIPYVMRFDSGQPGPSIAISALIHGNEVCGAIALDELLRLNVRPMRGSLTLAFCNVEAYARFDPKTPATSRYVDEDLNRVWSAATLEGGRKSSELKRARQLRPVFDGIDFLLDLHSMLLDREPLVLSGMLPKTLDFARFVGLPHPIVRDEGHAAGPRLRDYAGFADADSHKTALLVECGQHWEQRTAETATSAALRFLAASGIVNARAIRAPLPQPPQRVIDVTEAVTVTSPQFRFLEEYHGLDVVPKAGTAVARDGGHLVKTPYDNCVLIMPSRRLAPGQTAVRFGRYSG